MIAEFTFLAWALGLTVPIYWAIPSAWRAARSVLLTLFSIVLLYMLSPIILVGVAGYGLLTAGFCIAGRNMSQGGGRRRTLLKAASWGVFAPLAYFEHAPADLIAQGLLGEAALATPTISGLAFLGVSYTAIRAFIMIREALDGDPPGPLTALCTFVFFANFVAGPIAGSGPFRSPAARLAPEDALMGIMRLGWGGALFLILRPAIANFDAEAALGLAADGAMAAWIGLFQRFLALYVDFAGYTEIAIGSALLFGVRLPENFRRPYLARSVQEFWQRWHLSLGAFIGAYLFRPLVRQFGKPALAIFLAFTAIGLWHEVTATYFLWGIGHGAALALNMRFSRRFPANRAPRPLRIARGALGWAATMTYVAYLSSFANSDGLAGALNMTGRLLGLD